MTSDPNSKIAEQILTLVQEHASLKHLTENVDPSSLDPDPWKSNFAAVPYSKDPQFCDNIAELLGEKKSPIFVGVMRSVDDPNKMISQFHKVHLDSRKSEKSLMILAGASDYPVFSKIKWEDLNFFERVYIWALQKILYLIEVLRIRPLQSKLSHNLSTGIQKKVYQGVVYKNYVTGEIIKFNNMLPHHSHPLPTQFSVLLQVVYD